MKGKHNLNSELIYYQENHLAYIEENNFNDKLLFWKHMVFKSQASADTRWTFPHMFWSSSSVLWMWMFSDWDFLKY